MTERHSRSTYFISNRNETRGSFARPRSATASEQEGAFRFSEMVKRGTPPSADDALLRILAERMTTGIPEQDGTIPAGFTYLGQFVDHDLTRDATRTPFGTPVTAAQLDQARSPSLDLDSVYGFGPQDPGSAPFYQANGVKLLEGRTQEAGPPPVATLALDGFDLPRLGASAEELEKARMARIPDQRNDENLAVAQTHLAFIRFHNATVNDMARTGMPSALLFEEARKRVVFHYQWMIRHDFLPRIVDPAIVDDVFTNGRKVFEVDATGHPTMPIEFSVAAYRLGHSMIRDDYDWNEFFHDRTGGLDRGSLLNLFRFSGTSGNLSPPPADPENPLDGPFERLPTNWISDWTRLYDFKKDCGIAELAPAGGARINMARRIDTRLTEPLALLPLGSFGSRGVSPANAVERNLAFRNLTRGRMVALATAQEVAKHFSDMGAAVPILTAEDLLGPGEGGVDLRNLPDRLKTELVTETPLWFYVLREAEKLGGRLGAIGGRIVAETFHRAIEGSRISFLHEPNWRPTGGRHPGGFGMVDLLLKAYSAANGELRPLSPEAPRPTV
ncbi:MAG TPA: heme peroxidase family protein [Falsiroseomonas sp.]|jgi:hypothetical protein|nr:heme peroxidase family protein [Falsiroseomonas sp.]